MRPGKTHLAVNAANAVGAMTAKMSRATIVKTCMMPRQRTLLLSLTAALTKVTQRQTLKAIKAIRNREPTCSVSRVSRANAAVATATAVNAANGAMHCQTLKTPALRTLMVRQRTSAINSLHSKACCKMSLWPKRYGRKKLLNQ